jgi:hypothetical protein
VSLTPRNPLPTLAGTFKYSEPERKAYVPRATERPIMGLASSKNYITANAVEAILQGAPYAA